MKQRQQSGMTLIELLVVVVVIGILAGLLFPSLRKAREAARVKKARAEVQEIVKVWQSYWATYFDWPNPRAGQITPALVRLFVAAEVGSPENRLNIKFMDLPPRALSEGFCDPWGTPYFYSLDTAKASNQWHYGTRVYLANERRYTE